MRSAARLIVIALLLLSTAWQGFAAAAMLHCDDDAMPASGAGSLMRSGVCDHASMHAAAHATDTLHRGLAQDVGRTKHVAGCAACCVGLALQPSPPLSVVAPTGSFGPIPFLLAWRKAFVPETPQRPPQAVSA